MLAWLMAITRASFRTGYGSAASEALDRGLDVCDRSLRPGLNVLFNEFAQGKAVEDLFPTVATNRLKNLLAELSAPFRIELGPDEEYQVQPFDELLLGSVLRALGDPDRPVRRLYATGVPLGMGCRCHVHRKSSLQSRGARCQNVKLGWGPRTGLTIKVQR